ncbi:MAG: SusC/RagA family TonB-linked outer membrane protein, partial [Butyricimonas faecihominis]
MEALRITGSIGATLKNDRATASMISPLNYAMYANPYERPYNEDGSYASDITYNAQQSSIRPGLDWENFNILHDLNNNTNKSRYIDAEIQLKVEWEIIKGLMFTTHGIYNVNSNHNRIVEGANTYTNFKNNWYDYISYGEDLDLALVRGSLREATAYSNAYTFKNTLQYSKDIKDRHFINFFLGQEISDRTTHSSFNYSPVYDEVHNIIGFPDLSGVSANNINFDLLGNTGKERMKMSSFFANASYSYEDRYILTGAIRYDGSDIIGNRNQFTPLWNVALRWNL